MSTKVGTTMNGQERKTLSSQLDRLDLILDTLSEGLNEAVASTVEKAVELAVRQAVGQAVAQAVHEAVQAVLTEVLTNTELRAALRDVASPTQTQDQGKPSPQRQGLLGRAWDWVKAGAARVRKVCSSVFGQLARMKPVARAAWGLAKTFKVQLLAACGVGVAVGLTALWAGPWLGAAAGWASGFITSLAVQARNSLRRLLPLAPSPE